MFKKFSRWLVTRWQDLSGAPISYEDHPVVINHHQYRVVRGRTIDIEQLMQIEW